MACTSNAASELLRNRVVEDKLVVLVVMEDRALTEDSTVIPFGITVESI